MYSLRKKLYKVKRTIFKRISTSSQVPRLRSESPPILVYQMGKVGSVTVVKALKSLDLPNPIFHIHFLSQEGLKRARNEHVKPLPDHIKMGQRLRRYVNRRKDIRWKIVTLVRDPVGTMISGTFYTRAQFNTGLGSLSGEELVEATQNRIKAMFRDFDEVSDYVATWFDKELKTVFGVDVYSQVFDHAKGYTVISGKNADVLILRLENLDQVLWDAISQFLNIELSISKRDSVTAYNVQRGKEYAQLIDRMVIPEKLCAKVYKTKYAQHFYDPMMRMQLLEKWTKAKLG